MSRVYYFHTNTQYGDDNDGGGGGGGSADGVMVLE